MNLLRKELLMMFLVTAGCGNGAEVEAPTTDDTDTDAKEDVHPLAAITVTKSEAISTVAIVEWLEDLKDIDPADIEDAYVEYGLDDTMNMRAPVRTDNEHMRTVLLGMKAGMLTYKIRSTIVTDEKTYTSDVLTFETGYAPSDLPNAAEEYRHASLPVDDGFVLTGVFTGRAYAFIVDTEGDLVWWTPGLTDPTGHDSTGTSDFTLDWNGNYFYLIATNPNADEGVIRQVSLDGEEVVDFEAGRAHHSLKAVPEGGVVFVQNTKDADGADTCDAIVHLDEEGNLNEIFNWSDVIDLHSACHTNFVGYDASADGFYISSRNYDLAAYVSRDKVLKWAVGRDEYQTAVTDDFQMNEVGDIVALHGLFAWNEGKNLLLFNNTDNDASKILEYEFNTAFDAADTVWSYSREGAASIELGGVQRLTGGNTQITYSNAGVINQIAENGEVVHRLVISQPIGYGNWRPVLYGPPPQL